MNVKVNTEIVPTLRERTRAQQSESLRQEQAVPTQASVQRNTVFKQTQSCIDWIENKQVGPRYLSVLALF